MPTDYDFCGWVTKNDLKCADGKVIKRNAFKVNDGQKVPLVWNHQHNSVHDVLGHTMLENRPEGVYGYSKFNATPAGKDAKEVVKSGDVVAMSIWANNLDMLGPEVHHGVIREVSLVLAGANPGAFIESVLAHGESIGEDESEGIFYTNEPIVIGPEESLSHAEEPKKEGEGKKEQDNPNETVGDVLNTLSDKQKKAVAIAIGQAIEDAQKENEEEEDEVKHNIFETGGLVAKKPFISHDDMKELLKAGKRLGSLKAAVMESMESEDGILAHALSDAITTSTSTVPTDGMTVATETQNYGVRGYSMLIPDYRSLNTPPEFISRDMDWVQKFMSQVHHTPFSRIKSMYADITADEARAKGYIKGNQKKEEVFSTLKRTTSPTTIYKKQKIDRDDVIDIVDFDVIAWIKGEMEVMLEEEKARACLIGDGRPADHEDKINEQNVRPIVSDVALFNTVVKIDVATTDTSVEIAKKLVDAIIRAKKKYKGSGRPTLWSTEDYQTDMLLLEDKIGHKLYKTEAELATALRVKEIVPVEVMENQSVIIGSYKYPLVGTMVNPVDYNIGADKGGSKELFEDFDIDYNQMKYLIECRMSGALVKPYSAVTFVLNQPTAVDDGGDDDGGDDDET